MKRLFLAVICFFLSVPLALAQTTTTTVTGPGLELLKTAASIGIRIQFYPLEGCCSEFCSYDEYSSGVKLDFWYPSVGNDLCSWSGNKFVCSYAYHNDPLLALNCDEEWGVEIAFNSSGDMITAAKGYKKGYSSNPYITCPTTEYSLEAVNVPLVSISQTGRCIYRIKGEAAKSTITDVHSLYDDPNGTTMDRNCSGFYWPTIDNPQSFIPCVFTFDVPAAPSSTTTTASEETTTTTVLDTLTTTSSPSSTTSSSSSTTTTGDLFRLTSKSPKNGAKNVNWKDPDISMIFNRELDPDTVNTGTVLISYSNAPSYNIPYSCAGSGNSIACDPDLTGFGWLVKVTVKGGAGGVKSTAGETLASDYTWTFSTVPDMEVKIVPVQTLEEVPLVLNKATVVRVMATWNVSSDITEVPAMVKLTYNGINEYQKNAVFYSDDARNIPQDYIRRGRSANFYSRSGEVPITAFSGANTIKATVEPAGQTGSDPLTYESSVSVNFIQTPMPFTTLWCVANVGDFRNVDTVDISALSTASDAFLRKLYPVASTRTIYKDKKINIEPWVSTDEIPWLTYGFRCLMNLANTTFLGSHQVVAGVAPDNWMVTNYTGGGVHVNALFGLPNRAVLVSERSHNAIAAHEIGHAYGNDDLVNPVISPGYDIVRNRYIDTTVPNTQVPTLQFGWKALMDQDILAYEDGVYADVWMDRASYQTILNSLRYFDDIPVKPKRSSAEELMVMAGYITVSGGTEKALIERAYVVDNLWGISPEGSGDYSLELQDLSGAALGSALFTPVFEGQESGDRSGGFWATVAYAENTKKAVVKHGSSTLVTLKKSSNAPSVTITKPAASSVAKGKSQVQWRAEDADGDNLTYAVSFSSDDGETWEFVAMDLDETSYALDTTVLPSSSTCRLRVMANDGFNTATAVSGMFSISNAPTVIGTVPAAGTTGVPVDFDMISIRFRDDMDNSTLTRKTIMLQDDYGNAVPGRVWYDTAAQEAVFKPAQMLGGSCEYTGIVAADVKDASGKKAGREYTWAFTTGADSYAPSITAVSPQSSDETICLNQPVQVTFNKPMDQSSFTSQTFFLTDQSGSTISGSIVYDAASMSVKFSPGSSLLPSELQPNTAYTATVKAAAKDAAGNQLGYDMVWSFTTGEESCELTTTTTIFGEDACLTEGLYNDGICDEFCREPDPDCDKKPACPIEASMSPGSHALNGLRKMRDTVLAKSSTGQLLTAFYYRHADQMSAILVGHPDMRAALKSLILKNMPAVSELVLKGHAAVKQGTVKEMLGFIEALQKHADAEAGRDLAAAKSKISDGALLKELGITVVRD